MVHSLTIGCHTTQLSGLPPEQFCADKLFSLVNMLTSQLIDHKAK